MIRTLNIVLLTSFFFLNMYVCSVAKAETIEQVIARVAGMTGLPETVKPRAVKEVSLEVIFNHTKDRNARAAFFCNTRTILYALGFRKLLPHETTHLLQCDAGQDPLTAANEKQARWVQRIYLAVVALNEGHGN